MMTSRQKIFLVLLPILILALALRLIGIENPLFEREPSAWRQIHTNSTAQGYLQHGFKFFYPEVNFMGNPGYFAQEFPLYQYLVAGLYKFFGENVLWGRLLTIATSLGALTYLYFILRHFWGEVPAAAGSLYFAIIPLSAYYGRTVMIDIPVLFLSLAFTYHFLSYLEEGRRRSLFLVLILSILAFLIKATTAIVFFVPLMILPLFLRKRSVYQKWEFYLFLLLPLATTYLWKNYAEALNLGYTPLTVQYTSGFLGYWIFGPWPMRLDPDFYQILCFRAIKQSLTWAGIFLAGAGIILSFAQKRLRFLLLYLLAAIVYLLTFTNLNFIHEYYQIPLIPIFAAFIGVSMDFAQEKIKNYLLSKNLLSSETAGKILSPAGAIFLGILLLIPSVQELWRYSKIVDKSLMSTGRQVGQILPPGTLVVAVTSDENALPKYPQAIIYNIQPKALYAVGHRGWNLNFSRFTLSKIELLKQEGAQFIVMDLYFSHPGERIWRDMIVEALQKSYKEIFTIGRFLVFDLNAPPKPNPTPPK